MSTAKRSLSPQLRTARAVLWSAALFLAAAAVSLVGPGIAQAEPYLTVREGYKCSQCHVNKGGGGARTDYAKVYLETRMAASPGPMSFGGNPPQNDAGYGRVSPFVSVGADLRAAFTYTDFDHASPTSGFSRHSDATGSGTNCESCHTTTNGGGKLAEMYLRFDAIPDVATVVYSVNAIPTVSTKEFYMLLDKVLPFDGYVMAGTFRLPAGFQNTWDTPFFHMDQGGYGLGSSEGVVGLEMVRAKGGMQVGVEPGPFSASVTVSNPDTASTETRGSRVSFNGYAVTRLGVVGLGSTQDPLGPKNTRTTTEAYLGFSIGRITALGQVDQVTTKDDTAGTTLKQEGLMGEVDFLITKGHNLRLAYEAFDPDLDTKNDRRDRTSLIYEPFLTPYLQARLGYRLYAGPLAANNSGVDKNGFQVFGELHFVY